MAAELTRLQGALGSRYVVERELGRGGMAVVYLARDLVQDREVAIKVLHPDLSVALGEERFRREIEIERRLDHPHILGILDSGEAAGLLYYVMPFVSGESLRAKMDREGQLQIEDAVRIAAEAAEALDYAHSQGVLHRDVKPENILLEDGRALVADFGIARALSDEAGQRLTQTGVTLGTPVYMSPEQSFAERDLDGRSDLYSLGCVLYEMLAGTPPFTGPNAQAITARHHLEAVPSITVVRPTVSDEIEDLVYKALAKSRADRCPTGEWARSLRASLQAGRTTERRTVATRRDPQRIGGRRETDVKERRKSRIAIGVAAAALLLASTVGGLWYRQTTAKYAEAGTRVAVLYFQDASTGRRLGYLADGLTEALIEGMSTAGVDVVSRAGVLPFRGVGARSDSVVAALNERGGQQVGLVVEGSVTELEDEAGAAEVAVTLTDLADQRTETKRFRFPLDTGGATDVAAHMGEIETFLRRRIGEEVTMAAQQNAARDPQAWTLLQRAEYERKRADGFWRTGDTTRAARAYGAADSLAALAANRTPTWVDPPTLRGQLALRRAQQTLRPEVAGPLLEIADNFATKAVQLDARSADARELSGAVAFEMVNRGVVRDTAAVRAQIARAASELEAAVTQNPKQASAWVRLSQVAYQQLNRARSVEAAKNALQADAYLESAPEIVWRLFATAYDMAEPVEAKRWCSEGATRFPENARFLRCELLLMTMRGESPDIGRGWEIVGALEGHYARPERPFESRFDQMLLAAAIGRAGLADSARSVMVRARADRSIDPRGELQGLEAFARTVIGDKTDALALLEGYLREFPEHREGFRRLNTWWWQDISSEPRYLTLVRGG